MTTLTIPTVLHEALKCFEGIEAFDAMDISNRNLSKLKGHIPGHSDLLDAAISSIDGGQFGALKVALAAAKGQLHWKIDNGGYYAADADVGEGYRSGNMHTMLIGPEDTAITSNDFLMGFFLLTPWTLYRDHKHAAPEIYIPLTGPSGWRFDLGEWGDHNAGSKIFNEPEAVHATRVCETPFLALVAWTRDIRSICSVVHADDWWEIEEDLKHHRKV